MTWDMMTQTGAETHMAIPLCNPALLFGRHLARIIR
jgi:hypothetical protein